MKSSPLRACAMHLHQHSQHTATLPSFILFQAEDVLVFHFVGFRENNSIKKNSLFHFNFVAL